MSNASRSKKRKWTDQQWEKVLAKPYGRWTDAEKVEDDRRTAKAIANMEWFDVGGLRYLQIDHLIPRPDMWIAKDFREHHIRGFFKSEKLTDSIVMLNHIIHSSKNEHRGFHHHFLFTTLLNMQFRDSAVYAIQYNYDNGETVGVRGSFSFHGQVNWSDTHFICHVATESNQPEPDIILILPVPALSTSLYSLN